MSTDRMTRVNELLKQEIGEALFAVLHDADFDLSVVTITHVIASRNLREARVLVSILGQEGRRDHILALLRKHRGELQSRINKDLGLKYTPRLSFELDTSVERGDHVLGLLFEMDRQDEPAGPDGVGTDRAADAQDEGTGGNTPDQN
jgi:ribosome-binding factor A